MDEEGLTGAALLFRVLGNPSRLELLRLIGTQARTVGSLVEATGLRQPLVSQHLRTLRQAHLVSATRTGKEVVYDLADTHVSHMIDDAIVHAREVVPSSGQTQRTEEDTP